MKLLDQAIGNTVFKECSMCFFGLNFCIFYVSTTFKLYIARVVVSFIDSNLDKTIKKLLPDQWHTRWIGMLALAFRLHYETHCDHKCRRRAWEWHQWTGWQYWKKKRGKRSPWIHVKVGSSVKETGATEAWQMLRPKLGQLLDLSHWGTNILHYTPAI